MRAAISTRMRLLTLGAMAVSFTGSLRTPGHADRRAGGAAMQSGEGTRIG